MKRKCPYCDTTLEKEDSDTFYCPNCFTTFLLCNDELEDLDLVEDMIDEEDSHDEDDELFDEF